MMNKEQLIEGIQKEYNAFLNLVNGLSAREFESAPEGKWTPGQQLEHLARSVKPLALALYLPKSVLRFRFGKANRPSKTYEELVAKYKAKIQPGYVPQKQYLPRNVPFSECDKWSKKLRRYVGQVCRHIRTFPEDQLDLMVAPHPAIGILTLREMMYFTMYHAEHHRNLVERDQKTLNT